MAQAKAKKKPIKRQLKLPWFSGSTLTLNVSLVRRPKRKTKASLQATQTRDWSIVGVLLTVGIVGLSYGAWLVFNPPVLEVAPPVAAVHLASPSSIKQAMVAADATQLEIPIIGVSALVEIVNSTSNGSIQVPSNASVVGQYRAAPTPGEVGPAVIVGHVDSLTGPAVFWRLRELAPGQIITVKRVDGRTVSFKVDKVQNYSQADFPANEVYGNIDYPGLRLITCGGSFNLLTRHYSQNTVVFASIVLDLKVRNS
ncbi:MAG: class F sortase [Candidatus Saccharimonadales bacterium]